MSKDCVFLDQHNKPSKVYYSNLHLGEQAAMNLYLEKMQKYAFTKFQKNSSTASEEDIVNESLRRVSSVQNTEPGSFNNSALTNIFTNEDSVASLHKRASAIFVSKRIRKFIATKTDNPEFYKEFLDAISMPRVQIKDIKWSGFNLSTIFSTNYTLEEARNELEDYFGRDSNRFDKNEENLLFELQEQIYNIYNNEVLTSSEEFKIQESFLYDEQELHTGKGTGFESIVSEFLSAIAASSQSEQVMSVTDIINSIFTDNEGKTLERYRGIKRPEYEKVLMDIYNEYVLPYNKKKNVRFVSNFHVYNPNLVLKKDFNDISDADREELRKINNGAYARFDFVVFYDDPAIPNRRLLDTYDLKVKSESSYNYRNYVNNDALKGPLSSIAPTTHNKHAIQLNLYNYIFDSMNTNIGIANSKVIYVTGTPNRKGSAGSEVFLTNPKLKGIESVIDYRDRINDLFVNEGKEYETASAIQNVNKALYGDILGTNLNAIDPVIKIQTALKRAVQNPNTKVYTIRGKFLDGKPIKAKNEAELKRKVEDYFNKGREDSIQHVLDDVINYFNAGKVWKNKSSLFSLRDRQIDELLKTYDNKSHEIVRLRSLAGFRYADPNILVVKTKTSKPIIDVIYISTDNGKDLLKDDAGNIITNPLHNLGIPDINIYYQALPSGSMSFDGRFNKEEARLLTCADLGLQLVKQGIGTSLGRVVHGALTNGGAQKNNLTMQDSNTVRSASEYKPHLELIHQHKDIQQIENPFYSAVYNEEFFKSGSVYSISVLHQLEEFLNQDARSYFAPKDQETLKEYLDAYADNQSITSLDFKQYLADLQNRLAGTASGSMSSTMESVARDRGFQIVSNLILELNNIEFKAGMIRKEVHSTNRFSPTSRIANPVIQDLSSQIEIAETQIKRNYAAFEAKHNVLLYALYKKAGVNVSKFGMLNISEDHPKVFAPLYLIDPNDADAMNAAVKSGRADDLYKLEDPDNPSKPLNEAQINYIRFFNKYVKEELVKNEPKYKRNSLQDAIPNGFVPLKGASQENIRSRSNDPIYKKGWQFIKSKFNRSLKSPHKHSKIIAKLPNPYREQIQDINELQLSSNRRQRLGLGEHGEQDMEFNDPNFELLETNLSVILTDLVQNQEKIHAHSNTLAVKDALNVALFLDKTTDPSQEEAIDSTMNFIKDQIRLQVFADYYDDGKIGKFGDNFEKLTSLLVLGASPAQILLDTFQGLLGTIGVITSVDKKYIDKKYISTAFSTPALDAQVGFVLESMGLSMKDSDILDAKQFLYGKDSLFQSKWFMSINNALYTNYSYGLYKAHLQTIGAWDAVKYDRQTQAVTYSIHKDKRFEALFNTDGSKKKITTPTPAEQEALARYNLLVKELSNEGGLNEEGEPTRPLSNQDILNLKELNLKFFGSMTKDSKGIAQLGFINRALFKFKNFIPTKITNYYMKSHESSKRSEIIFDPETGQAERKKLVNQGIIQTLGEVGPIDSLIHMLVGGAILFKREGAKGKTLTTVQKENLKKLRSDMTLAIILLVLLHLLEPDKEKEKEKEKQAKEAGIPYKKPDKVLLAKTESVIKNLVGDVSLVHLIYGVIAGKGSLYVTGSVMIRSVQNISTGLYYSTLGGDMEQATEKFASIVSAIKLIYDLGKEDKYALPSMQ